MRGFAGNTIFLIIPMDMKILFNAIICDCKRSQYPSMVVSRKTFTIRITTLFTSAEKNMHFIIND